MTVKDDPECVVTSPVAKQVMEDHDLRAVMVLAVRKDGVIDVATYGENTFACDAIAAWARSLVADTLTKLPFQTAFGYANGGIPKRLSEGELLSLRPGVREYAEQHTHPDAV